MNSYTTLSAKIRNMPKKTKANDRKDVSVRLSVETYEKVEQLAKMEDRSISNFIARIIEQYVAVNTKHPSSRDDSRPVEGI